MSKEFWINVTVVGSEYEEQVDAYSNRYQHRRSTPVLAGPNHGICMVGEWIDGPAPTPTRKEQRHEGKNEAVVAGNTPGLDSRVCGGDHGRDFDCRTPVLMTWTTAPPTAPGWYWIERKVFGVEMVRVSEDTFLGQELSCEFVGSDVPEEVSAGTVERWLGPIPEPQR